MKELYELNEHENVLNKFINEDQVHSSEEI